MCSLVNINVQTFEDRRKSKPYGLSRSEINFNFNSISIIEFASKNDRNTF